MSTLSNATTAFARFVLCVALFVGARPALAEDIDIFSALGAQGDLPNVLLVLDNSANWTSSIPAPTCTYDGTSGDGPRFTNPGQEQGKKMAIEKCALYNLIHHMPVKPSGGPDNDALFNVGIMLLNESPNNGAYPRKAFAPLTSTNKLVFKEAIRNLNISGDKGSNADFAKALYEAYLYFKGLPPYMGTAGTEWDSAAVASGRYVSPAANSCARNHLIFIANGSPESSENNDALALLRAAGGNTTRITYDSSGSLTPPSNTDQANWSDEFGRFLSGTDVSAQPDEQRILLHTVAVTGASSDGLYPRFIEAMSTPFGGTYHSASNATDLLRALQAVFNEIQAVNSVFSASSLPVSVNSRGTYQNQVFMAMFRPDAAGRQRWRGNLKQYQFGLDNLGALQLVDSSGVTPAVSSTTGFISTSAISFWTQDSTFWVNESLGTPPSPSDRPDGEVVEKGGVAQQIRSTFYTSQDARKVLTCLACTSTRTILGAGGTRFDTANTGITSTALGVAAAERDLLIDWVRGTRNAVDENAPAGSTIRPSVHGDVLHSRPAVVNYGGSIGTVVFYGANDGMLRAVVGNQTGADAGNELWSFVPEEMFGKLKRLRANSPLVLMAGTLSAGAEPRDYFVDGPIGVYQRFRADRSVAQVIIYVGMRRGGRLLYAIDVTDPANPAFLWKTSPTQLPQLGQTWSEPKVARLRGRTNPVLVFGGGYDGAAEDNPTQVATTMGHRVYVLDAITGAAIKTFNTTRSVPADVTLVDSDFDGYIDRGYAVDLAGKVYRLDFETAAGSTDPDNWSIYSVADLSGGTGTGRKFFYAPDAVVTRSFTALMVGSGDREKPLLETNQDHFFQIFDNNIQKGAPDAYVPTTWSDLLPTGTQSSIAGRGCYVPLRRGEKVVNAATSIAGATYFGTNQPTGSLESHTCRADLGVARSYAMPLFCTTPTDTPLDGGGLPPSPVSGIVTVTRPDGTAEQVPFCIGCPNPRRSAIEGSRINPAIKVPRSRLYWYQETKR